MTAFRDEYWIDPAEIDKAHPKRRVHMWTAGLLIGCIAVTLFLTFTTVNESTHSIGRVVPSSQVQAIANLEGGILKELLVTDGQMVKKGQIVARISNSTATADYGDLTQRRDALRARLMRLTAEANGMTSPDDINFGETAGAASLTMEKQQFITRKAKLDAEMSSLQAALQQRESDLAIMQNRAKMLGQQLAIANQELSILGKLAKNNAGSEGQYLAKQREVLQLQAQIDSAKLSIPAMQATVDEAKNRMKTQHDSTMSNINEDLAHTQDLLNEVEQRLKAGGDRYARTELKSPVDGIVKDIRIHTIGGVLRPGQELMEIVPVDDTLLIEARVSPTNIGFLQKGLPARVRVGAYDFTKFGYLDAVVEDISADTVGDQRVDVDRQGVSGQAAKELAANPTLGGGRAQSYYRVYLRTKKNYLDGENGPLPIIPGMTVDADILTGEKTLLEYLFKPIIRANKAKDYEHAEGQ